MRQCTIYAATAAGASLLLGTMAMTLSGTSAVGAQGTAHSEHLHDNTVNTHLHSLNDSGAIGQAMVTVDGRKLHVRYNARRLAHGLPHAAHIHYGAEARHECPTLRDDANHDFRINVAEGVPEYGPIAKSLTTRGDTSPDSALAVDRFPTAKDGTVRYHRLITAKRSVARAVRHGEGVLVIHGVDHNHNGKYDFEGAGKSELDPKLPAEATDPAVCGVLR